MLTRSGIAPLDARLGGIVPGRPYVLSGASGTGKSLACLEFLHVALEAGEPAAMLTHDDPDDLMAQAEYLGIDLGPALRDERLVLLRYQLDFARRFARLTSPDAAFAELRSLLGGCMPRRLAIDSIAPFVDSGTAAGMGLVALLEFLDACDATALLTYPGELTARYDRRLEPLVQRAAAILHLTAERDRSGTLEIRKVRFAAESTAPVRYVIRPGVGLVPMLEEPLRRASDVTAETRRRVLLLADGDSAPRELVQLLQSRFDVATRGLEEASEVATRGLVGLTLVAVRRDSLEDALGVVRTLRARGASGPIALVSAFTLRAADRARALRAGCDDFYGAELAPDELVLRLERLAHQGRPALPPCTEEEPCLPDGVDARSVLDEHTFRNVLQSRITTTGVPFFTLVRLTPTSHDASALTTLAETARAQARTEGGDLAGRLDGGVAVYLHSARRKDVPTFVRRVRDAWRAAGGGDLDVMSAAYPSDADTLGHVLRGPAA